MQTLKRREFLQAAALVATGGLLAACQPKVVEKVVEKVVKETVIVGGTPQVVEKVVKETVVVKEPTKAPKQNVTIRNLMWNASAVTIPLWESLAQTFMTQRPDIKVEFIYTPNAQFAARMQTMVAANDPPEICMPIGGSRLNDFRDPENDKWLDQKPLVERDNYDLSDFHASGIESVTNPFNGQQDGLPVNLFGGMLAYNKDIFAKAGIPEPPHKWDTPEWTLEKFIETAKLLTLDDKGKHAGEAGFNPEAVAQWGYWDIETNEQQWGWKFGGEAIRSHPTDRYHCYIGEKPFMEGVDYLASTIYDMHIRMAPAQSAEFMGMLSSPFHTGKVAMQGVMTQSLTPYVGIKDFKWDFAARPAGPAKGRFDNKLWMDQCCMFAAAKFHDQAWDWIKFIASPENAHRISTDMIQCLPCRKSAMPKYGERLNFLLPGIDSTAPQNTLTYAHFFEFWAPPVGWADIYNPARDAVILGEKKSSEVFPDAQTKIEALWAEYFKKFPNLKLPARLTF